MKLGRTLMAATVALSLTSGASIAQQSDEKYTTLNQFKALDALVTSSSKIGTGEAGEPSSCPVSQWPYC